MPCLDDDTLLRFAQGRLSKDERARVEAHLDGCEDCRSVLAEAAKVLFPQSGAPRAPARASHDPPAALAPGTKIGRFEVAASLGAGAAGVVYRAFDPQLERAVALKLVVHVSATPSGAAASEGGARLLREARAMAQLSHPNVVNVYDAGIWEEQVFIVMELVDGQTLADWLRAGPRTWQEIVGVFVDAGRGLSAAHGAGLVHRDFKPENVLLGAADGRVRVTDFGLARSSAATAADPAGRVIAGTPAYMAPEQFLGNATDARTDQFNFCVTLYVALYGQHPFADAGVGRPNEPLVSLASEVVAGKLRAPPASPEPKSSRVRSLRSRPTVDEPESSRVRSLRSRPTGAEPPQFLFDLIARGLAPDPADRYPSMDDLLSELERRLAPPERGRLSRRARLARVALAAVTAGVLAGGLVWRLRGAGPPPVRCGNGALDPGEECDDGNTRNGDACSASCLACREGAASFVWDSNGHCYSRHDDPKTWSEAEATCEALDGTLVSYTTTYEPRALWAALLRGHDGPNWIGLVQTRGAWAWLSGERADDGGPWAPGEPRAGGETEARCVQATTAPTMLNPKAPDFGNLWRATSCAERLPFVCERSAWSRRARDGHLYRFFAKAKDWDAASATCTAAHAHLATIADADEQAFVAALAQALFWIGGTDRAHRRQFEWVTREPMAYRAFAPGEPDDPETPTCIILGRNHLWHDRPCRQLQPFVCEID